MAALGQVLFGAGTSAVLQPLLAASGKRPETTKEEKDENMAYDIIGEDIFGGVGADLLVGADDELLDLIAGDDDDDDIISGEEIVGAAARSRKRAALKKAIKQRVLARDAKMVVRRTPDRERRYPIGFVPTSVAAGATTSIPAAPQNLFRVERLVVPSSIAADFGISDIKVGNQSQLVQNIEVPAELFSEVAIDTNVSFDSANIGNQISLDARNKTAAAVVFSAGAIGTIAK